MYSTAMRNVSKLFLYFFSLVFLFSFFLFFFLFFFFNAHSFSFTETYERLGRRFHFKSTLLKGSSRAKKKHDRILNQISIHMLQNRNALRTCGSAVTQRFTQYCQVSCVLSSTRFKLSLSNR